MFLFTRVIRVNEKKILQKFVENWNIGTQTATSWNEEDFNYQCYIFLKQGFFYFVVFGTLTSSRLQSKFFP